VTKRRWSFRGEQGLHVVELVHGYLTGKRKLSVNGRVMLEASQFLDGGSHHAFELEGRACTIDITCPTGIAYRYALMVDGIEIPFDDGTPVTLPAIGAQAVPVPTTPAHAEPRDVPVQSRFIDLTRWFKGER
jgi:hypothetical protein